MSAVKKTISLPKKLLEKGQARAEEMHYPTFSDYIQELIRRDSELREVPVPYQTAPPPARAESSLSKPQKKLAG